MVKAAGSRLLALATMAALFQPAVPAQAHHGLSLRWDRYSIPVVNNAGPAWELPAQEAIERWNVGSPVKLQFNSGLADGCAVVPRQIVLCEKPSRYLGITTLYTGPTGGLESVVISVSPRARTVGSAGRRTMCHELGHALGLNHQSAHDSCMRHLAGPEAPNEHDYEQLRLIYSPRPSAPACFVQALRPLCLFGT